MNRRLSGYQAGGSLANALIGDIVPNWAPAMPRHDDESPRPAMPDYATRWQRLSGRWEPATVLEWSWSCDFRRWGAVVRFADGEEIFTYPASQR